MNDKQKARLEENVNKTLVLIQRFRDKDLGEQNTKASLIDPILDALGWDIRDPDEVHREYKPTSKDCPVDYALKLLRKARLFVEAKGLGETLSDRKWIAQVLGYAIVAGVEWCVLTDGDEYRIYNATAAVDAEEKLLCKIKLSEASPSESVKILELISKTNLEGNTLDDQWNSQFIDRRVKQTIQSMISTPDKGLVRLIRRRAAKLTAKEIVKSLRRLDVQIESPATITESVPSRKAKSENAPPQKAAHETGPKEPSRPQKEKARYAASLQDVIGARLLAAPCTLFRKYKGKTLEATLRPDGKVEFEGVVYDTCSSAAEFARSTVTGRKMNTNGWAFWQFTDKDGKKKNLFDARQRFLETKGYLPTQD
jgi:predicted type IV restriction endonuclease